MVHVILVSPGTTDFDEQRRIVGNLDIPLNSAGADQAARMANELQGREIQLIYTAPSQAAVETAEAVAQGLNVKCKTLSHLDNLDHGLWQGKLIDEVKATQRKVYRQWREQPETVCPPEGETLESAQRRVKAVVDKLLKKHKSGAIALVVPEPLAGLVHCHLTKQPLTQYWHAEPVCGSWQIIEVDRDGAGHDVSRLVSAGR